jgi:translation initiation factor IF-2
MAKMRVHELAKELGRQSKELLTFLQDKGYEVKVSSNSIGEEEIALVRKEFGTGAPQTVTAEKESGED